MAINGIVASPDVNFLIEERSLGRISYTNGSAAADYDDLDYTFNFEVFFAGAAAPTRLASQYIDFVADTRYTILASGTVANTVLTVWESEEREFAATDTVFQARFAHTSAALGDVDVYFALDGVAPVLGEQVATLSPTEISAPMDFESDDYVVTITSAGLAGDILYQSSPSTLSAQTDLIIAPFDGGGNTNASIIVRAISAFGAAANFGNPDPTARSTIQFLHAARDMGDVDVYDDADLTSLVLDDHTFGELTAPMAVDDGLYEFFYTPFDDTSAVLVQSAFGLGNNVNIRSIITGFGGTYAPTNFAVDRRSIDTGAKLNFFNASSNVSFVNIYVVDAGETIEGAFPFRSGVISGVANPYLELAPGNYDVYLTGSGTVVEVAGPFTIDVAIGDIVDMVAFDTEDTAVLEIVVFPNP